MTEPARVLVVDDSATIRKVVSAILTRHGYQASLASDGAAGLSMLERDPADLILLDFVMPKMNGYQFCRALRSKASMQRMPVVLMSAKGDKIRGQFVQQTGAVDAITKPFDARALVAVVEGALAKTKEGRARPVPEGPTMPDEDTLAESQRPSQVPRQLRARATIEVAQHVTRAVAPAILELSPEDRASEAAIMRAIAASLTPGVLGDLARTLHELGSDSTGEVLSGDISAVPVAEVLQVLSMQRQSGVLRVASSKTVITMWFKEGQVELVQSRGASDEFRLGRYFLERGLLSRDEMEELLARPAEQKKLLGQWLVELGRVTQEDLAEALKKQSSELIYDLLRWRFGRFAFLKEPLGAEAAAANLSLGVSGLVLEGFRRVDEWRLMESAIEFDRVLWKDEVVLDTVKPDQLTRNDKVVLDAVDGKRTVNEVIRETNLSSFDAIKILYQFLQSKVLRHRG